MMPIGASREERRALDAPPGAAPLAGRGQPSPSRRQWPRSSLWVPRSSSPERYCDPTKTTHAAFAAILDAPPSGCELAAIPSDVLRSWPSPPDAIAPAEVPAFQ